MKNKFKILALLGLIALTSCGGGGASSGSSTGGNQSSTSVSVTIEGNYQYFIQSDSSANRSFMRTPYIANVSSSADATLYNNAQGKQGSELKNSLKSIINGMPSNYSKDASRFRRVDQDPSNANNIWCIYVRDSYVGTNIGSSGEYVWNREHTYPDSKLSGTAKNDLLILFADDNETNSVRGNNKYGIVSHSSGTAVKDSAGRTTANWSSGSVFEPCDAAKGEVARATLYAYVKYDEPITDNFQSLDLCLKWHNDFPPTSWEMLRNNRNQTVQGNRNPFIDHPEYADLLF